MEKTHWRLNYRYNTELQWEDYSFIVAYEQESTGGLYSCYLPAYNLYFSSREEDISKKAKALVASFFNFSQECFKEWLTNRKY